VKKDTEESLAALLRAHDLRPTRARLLILSLFGQERNHLTNEEIVRAARARRARVGTATLHQNVAHLVEAGLLIRSAGPDGVLRYDSTLEHHHHIVCEKCGRMQDAQVRGGCDHIEADPFHSDEKTAEWTVRSVVVKFIGLCPSCRE
jgi:Fe2+ or Zn2+ uptake regulation protein